MKRYVVAVAVIMLAGVVMLGAAVQPAQARWSVHFGIGGPLFWGPSYPYYYYPPTYYYPPNAVYAQPPPTYYYPAPAPVYVQPPTTYAPPPTTYAPPPAAPTQTYTYVSPSSPPPAAPAPTVAPPAAAQSQPNQPAAAPPMIEAPPPAAPLAAPAAAVQPTPSAPAMAQAAAPAPVAAVPPAAQQPVQVAAVVQQPVVVVDARTAALLGQLMRGDDDARKKAAKELKKFGGQPAVVAGLIDALQRDGSKDVRKEAANSLGDLLARDAQPALRQAAREDREGDVRQAALKSARKIETAYGIQP